MMELSQIWIYPVKSLGGISLKESWVSDRGLEFDRRWLLVDDQAVFLSQREHPALALFKAEMQDDRLIITHRESKESLSLALCPVFESSEPLLKVSVWDDEIDAYEVSTQASKWFSALLGFSTRLVYMPDDSKRKVDPDYVITGEEITSFSDAYPFLIIGQASLDDLNGRLQQKVAMNRFRPNFVFTGAEAFEEGNWREFKIGALSFVGVKPCARCVMTTVDQEQGVISSKEPLKTLSQYRNFANKVLFGENLLALGQGKLNIGDEIRILSLKK